MMELTLQTLPPLHWHNSPLDWQIQPDHRLTILAGEQTDWFTDPGSDPLTGYTKDNAPAALFHPPDENFTLSAKVTVDFASTFDAGVLQVRESDSLWAKFCFEYSPQEKPMIVSVVTRGVSDDCNSQPIAGNEIYLRVTRKAEILAFHYSQDGRFWHLVRYFTLGPLNHLRVGFSSQSPTGQRCQAVFSEVVYQVRFLNDFRNGE
jgi:uncharacterized protein